MRHVTEYWRRGHACYKVVMNLAELCSCLSVLLKVEFVSNEIGYLVEEISKYRGEGVAWLLLNACSQHEKSKMT